jgi:hypothetical protein
MKKNPTMRHFNAISLLLALLLAAGLAIPCQASELGHYSPALPGIRDFIMPDPGLYYLQYILYYTTDTLKDKNGNSIRSISVGPLEFAVETEVDSYMLVPTLVYATDFEILGARYAALIAQPLGNVSVQAALESDTIPGFGLEVDESGFGLGDTYVRPLWLGWSLDRFDIGAAYSLYLPTGKYDDGEADNVGLGMWTHEFMANVAYYPGEQRGATALTLAGIYEIHHEKDDIDITPGSHLSINAGISQYLPLGEKWLAELGVAGTAQWQLTEDRGSDALNKNVKDQVYGIGPEVGFVYLPWEAQFKVRWTHEFEAEDRFEGDFLTVTAAFSF